ncbi:MAG: hypothetical protein R2789_19555 [Microthrixaceae bacterium]
MSQLTSAMLEDACTKYVERVGDENVDSLMELFADGCVVEDPVGSDKRVGLDDVRALRDPSGCRVSAKLAAVPRWPRPAPPFPFDQRLPSCR